MDPNIKCNRHLYLTVSYAKFKAKAASYFNTRSYYNDGKQLVLLVWQLLCVHSHGCHGNQVDVGRHRVIITCGNSS